MIYIIQITLRRYVQSFIQSIQDIQVFDIYASIEINFDLFQFRGFSYKVEFIDITDYANSVAVKLIDRH